MFRDSIQGMDNIFNTEPPPDSVVLVVGNAGSMKSAFIYNLISKYLSKRKETLDQAIYVTLEETRDSLLRNVASMGIPTTERIQISDIASFMRELEYWAENFATEKDYMELILEKASRPLQIYKGMNFLDPRADHDNGGNGSLDEKAAFSGSVLKPTIFVLDSINALNTMVYRTHRNVRREMQSFFWKLRERNVTSFIVMEVGKPNDYRPEHFLVDGIIELGIKETKEKRFKRYLRVQKMRSTKHSIEPFLVEVTKKGIRIVEELI